MILFAYCKYIKSKVSSLFQIIIFAEKKRTIARCKLQCVLLSIHKFYTNVCKLYNYIIYKLYISCSY